MGFCNWRLTELVGAPYGPPGRSDRAHSMGEGSQPAAKWWPGGELVRVPPRGFGGGSILIPDFPGDWSQGSAGQGAVGTLLKNGTPRGPPRELDSPGGGLFPRGSVAGLGNSRRRQGGDR